MILTSLMVQGVLVLVVPPLQGVLELLVLLVLASLRPAKRGVQLVI